MADATFAAVTGETLLRVGLPIVLLALLVLAVRLRKLREVLGKYPFTSAFIEIALVLAAGWSFGTAAEILRDVLVPDQSLARPGIFVSLAMSLAVSLCVGKLIETIAVAQESHGHGDGLSRLSRTLLYGACLFAGMLVFLAANDFPRLTVVAGGSAAVVAFALRQTLTDVVAGIALAIERPVKRRDWVMLEDGTVAQVIDMDWRATQLRGWDRAISLVPNAQLASQVLRVLPKPGELYADTLTVLVSGDVDPELAKSLLGKSAQQCQAILRRPAPQIRLADASSLPYRYSLWVHYDGYMSSFAGREELFFNIHKTFVEAGIQVATEIQDVRVERKHSASRQ